MAQTLAPVLGASSSGEAPVSQQHWLGSVADLVGGFAQTMRGASGPSASDAKLQRESSYFDFLRQEEERAFQHEQTTGDLATANRIRRNAVLQATKAGIDPGSSQMKGVLRNLSGEDPEDYGFSADETQRQKLLDSPEFQTFYAATDPSLPTDQREAKALADIQALEANKARTAMAQVHWDSDGQKAYLDLIDLGVSRVTALTKNTAGAASVQEIQQSRLAWEQVKVRDLARPAKVTDEQWKPVADRIAAVDSTFDSLERLMGAEGMANINKAKAQEIFSSVSTMMLEGDPTVGTALTAAGIALGDFDKILNAMPNLQREAKALQDIYNKPFSVEVFKADPEKVKDSYSSTVGQMDAAGKYKTAMNLGQLVNGKDNTAKIKGSPEDRNLWVQNTVLSFEALKALETEQTVEWISNNDYDKIFSTEFYANVNALREVDPQAAGEVLLSAKEALESQRSRVNALMSGIANQESFFIWDQAKGTFTLNPNPTEFFKRLDEKGAGAGGGQAKFQRMLDTVYGGDINGLIADKGAKLFRLVQTPTTDDPQGAFGGVRRVFSPESQEFNDISRLLGMYFGRPEIRNADLYAKTIKKNEEVYNKLFGAPTVSGGEGQPEVKGSAGNDSLAPASLIRTESGGNFGAKNDAQGAGGKGHFGRVQFSIARLEEAKAAGAIPSSMTPEQFLQDPAAQVSAENWHFSDIRAYITKNELGRYVGQSINGVPVTLDGMVAVAHLGGKAGLKKFVESGGKYNPSDANGTSLLEYLGTHQGNTSVQTASPVSPAVSNPPVTETPLAQEASLTSGEGSATQVTPEKPTVSGPAAAATPEGTTSSEASTLVADTQLAKESQEVLRNLGLSPDTPVFSTKVEFYRALRQGLIPDGTTVVVEGEVVEA